MSSRIFHTTALAVALSLTAGGAIAQPSAQARPGYTASLVDGQAHTRSDTVRSARPLTVMGLTGGIEPKDVDATGSIVPRLPIGQMR